MSPRKKKVPAKSSPKKRAAKRSSDEHPPGLWIDPQIWRRIKGEGGRRGLEGLPSAERFLHFADVALGNTRPAKSKKAKKSGKEENLP